MKKKILFVTNSMGLAGAETALCSLLSELNYDECEVSFYSIIAMGMMFKSLPKEVKILNKNQRELTVASPVTWIYLLIVSVRALLYKFYIFRNWKNLYTLIKYHIKCGRFQPDKLLWDAVYQYPPQFETEFDLAVAFLEGGATYYVANRVKAKKKASVLHIDYIKAGYYNKTDRPFYEKMDKVFCVSEGVMASFNEAFPDMTDKSGILRNIVNIDKILAKGDQGTGFTDGFTGIRLLTVGRLHVQKAYDIAIYALSIMVKNGYNDVRWYVIGDGSERIKLEAIISKCGLADKFILLGYKDNPYPFLKQCDIYVQASHFEGWSISMAEALIYKKLIVASRCTGNVDQITDGKNGVLVDLTVENLAQCLMKFIDDYKNDSDRIKKIREELRLHSFNFDNEVEKIYSLMEE